MFTTILSADRTVFFVCLQFFFVLKGRPRFLVGRQTYDLAVESQIRIPAGVIYAIKNMHRSLARLYFHCHNVR